MNKIHIIASKPEYFFKQRLKKILNHGRVFKDLRIIFPGVSNVGNIYLLHNREKFSKKEMKRKFNLNENR